MEGKLLMSDVERRRLTVLSRVKSGELSIKDASKILSLSYRHCKRIYRRYRLEGDAGLVNRNRGRPSNRSIDTGIKGVILDAYRTRYPDFGPTFATEKLEEHGYKVDHETLRRWLLSAGLWQPKRRRNKHRSRRDRKDHFGEMVQMDGSHHAWFEDRGEKCCLMNMVDDASGKTLGGFDEEETTRLAMLTLWDWIDRYGIPASIYADRKNVFVSPREPTLQEQLDNEIPLTQFGKACHKLGIKIIPAYSPQAKGRVERKNAVYQDRLVKELRLAGISQISEGNKFLASGFIDNLNKKFSVKPRSEADYHRPIPEGLDFRKVFCFEEQRQVGNDWVVRYHSRFFQIKGQSKVLPPAKDNVTVSEWLDDSIHILYRNHEVEFEEIYTLPQKQVDRTVKEIRPRKKYIPPADHPWRRPLFTYRSAARKHKKTTPNTGTYGRTQ